MLQPANYNSNSLPMRKFFCFLNRKEALTIKLANCRFRNQQISSHCISTDFIFFRNPLFLIKRKPSARAAAS